MSASFKVASLSASGCALRSPMSLISKKLTIGLHISTMAARGSAQNNLVIIKVVTIVFDALRYDLEYLLPRNIKSILSARYLASENHRRILPFQHISRH